MTEGIIIKQDMFCVEFGDEYPLSLSVYAESFLETRAVFNALAARYLIVSAYKPNGELISAYDNTRGICIPLHV